MALRNGLNANLLRKWVIEGKGTAQVEAIGAGPAEAEPSEQFIALPLMPEASNGPVPIKIDLRRGATTITVTWPVEAAAHCAVWLREWLR